MWDSQDGCLPRRRLPPPHTAFFCFAWTKIRSNSFVPSPQVNNPYQYLRKLPTMRTFMGLVQNSWQATIRESISTVMLTREPGVMHRDKNPGCKLMKGSTPQETQVQVYLSWCQSDNGHTFAKWCPLKFTLQNNNNISESIHQPALALLSNSLLSVRLRFTECSGRNKYYMTI